MTETSILIVLPASEIFLTATKVSCPVYERLSVNCFFFVVPGKRLLASPHPDKVACPLAFTNATR